jgi:hypothetical protein
MIGASAGTAKRQRAQIPLLLPEAGKRKNAKKGTAGVLLRRA